MISVAGLKGTEGPRLAGPESFKVKAVHLVSVLIDHRHIISPVQGLICPWINTFCRPLQSFVGGDRTGLIIPGRCESEPIFCSLLSSLLVDFVFSDMHFLKHRGIRGLSLCEERTCPKINQKWNMLLWKKFHFLYLLGLLQKWQKTYPMQEICTRPKKNTHKFNIRKPCRCIFAYVSKYILGANNIKAYFQHK